MILTSAAISIFIISYALIATERVHRVAAALGGVAAMVVIGWSTPRQRSSTSTPASTGTSSFCCSDDGHRRRPQADRPLRIPCTVGGTEVRRTPLQAARPAHPGHRHRLSHPRQRHLRPARRPGDAVGLPPARAGSRAVPHLTDPGLQHRRHGDPDRRPAEHHHRQPGRAELRRLPGPLPAAHDHPAGRVRADVAGAVPKLPVRRRSTCRLGDLRPGDAITNMRMLGAAWSSWGWSWSPSDSTRCFISTPRSLP